MHINALSDDIADLAKRIKTLEDSNQEVREERELVEGIARARATTERTIEARVLQVRYDKAGYGTLGSNGKLVTRCRLTF